MCMCMGGGGAFMCAHPYKYAIMPFYTFLVFQASTAIILFLMLKLSTFALLSFLLGHFDIPC